jgi:hypothetical protein
MGSLSSRLKIAVKVVSAKNNLKNLITRNLRCDSETFYTLPILAGEPITLEENFSSFFILTKKPLTLDFGNGAAPISVNQIFLTDTALTSVKILASFDGEVKVGYSIGADTFSTKAIYVGQRLSSNTATTTTPTLVPNSQTANNLAGGVEGAIPYQYSRNATAFLQPGFLGQALVIGPSGLPVWGYVSGSGSSGSSAETVSNTIISYRGINYTTTSAGATEVVETLPSSAYRSINYKVQVSSGGEFSTSDVLLIHNGVDVFINEVNIMSTAGILANFDAQITAAGYLEFLVSTPLSGTVIKAAVTALTV